MANKNTKFQIKNKYYLSGPLALVAFFLFDVIGGFNTPGYLWTKNCVADLTALNSYSLPISLAFSIIYALLTLFAGICICKYIKDTKFNKTLKRGLRLFLMACVVLAIGSNIFLQPKAGTYNTIQDSPIIGTSTQAVQDEEGNYTDSVESIDFEATTNNLSAIADSTSEPLMIGNMIIVAVSFVWGLAALIMIIVGGFKKKGNSMFAGLAIFFTIMMLYSAVGFFFPDFNFFAGASESLGLTSRFMNYTFVLLPAIFGAYIYVTDIKNN